MKVTVEDKGGKEVDEEGHCCHHDESKDFVQGLHHVEEYHNCIAVTASKLLHKYNKEIPYVLTLL